MADTELRKLNRKELLTMLVEITQRCDELEEELESTKAKLEDKNLEINNAGSLAEAVLKINGVMEAADKATKQYLENIKARYDDPNGEHAGEPIVIEKVVEKIVEVPVEVPVEGGKGASGRGITAADKKKLLEEIKKEQAAQIAETQKKCKTIEDATKKRCLEMVETAKKESQTYWDEVYGKIKKYSQMAEALKRELGKK